MLALCVMLIKLFLMGSPFSYLMVSSPQIQKASSTTFSARKVRTNFFPTTSLQLSQLFEKQATIATISLMSMSNRQTVQQPTTIFFMFSVIPFQAARPLAMSVITLTIRQITPMVVMFPVSSGFQSKPKKRKSQARLPGLLEQRWIQQKLAKRMRRVITTMKIVSTTANLQKSLPFAQTLLPPQPAKATTKTIPARMRLPEKKMQKGDLLKSVRQRLMSTPTILAASMMRATAVMSPRKEPSQPASSSLEMNSAMRTDSASCRKRTKMLKARLLDQLISTSISTNMQQIFNNNQVENSQLSLEKTLRCLLIKVCLWDLLSFLTYQSFISWIHWIQYFI